MEKLKKIVDKKLFTPTILPKLSEGITYTEYGKNIYNNTKRACSIDNIIDTKRHSQNERSI